jgi:hypothetical protein
MYGRCYQLVLDKSKAVPKVPGRAECAKKYVKTRSIGEIIEEAEEIIRSAKKKKDWCNVLTPIKDLQYNDKYYGRCVQFLLDSNHNRCLADLLSLAKEKLEEMAHEERQKQLLPKLGTEFRTSKLCEYECGECTWTYGEKRCSGDNRRYMLEWFPLKSLDDTYVYAYPEPY